MRAIVGLGNPGVEYAETRHNAGFWLADRIATRWGLGPWRPAPGALAVAGTHEGARVRVLKPQTYMNRSGAVIAPLCAQEGFDVASDLLVLVDDVALPAGRFRLRGAGSSGGHNGLRHIEAVLGRQDYARLRVGVGPVPPGTDDLAEFVLSPLPLDDRARVEAIMDPMVDAAALWLAEGIERAMNHFNR